MEILFCDRCKESIPDADLEMGRAVRVGSRLYHVPCALGKAMPGFGRVALVLLVLGAVGLSAYAVSRSATREEPKKGGEVPKAWADELAKEVKKERDEVVAHLDAQVADLRAEIAKAVETAQGKMEKSQADALDRAVLALQSRVDAITDLHMRRFETDEKQIAEIAAWAKDVKDLAARLAASPPAPSGTPAAPPSPPVAPPTAPEPATPPVATEPKAPEPLDPEAQKAHDAEVDKWIAHLKDSSVTIAYSAAFKLKTLKDPRSVPALVDTLRTHKDIWVKAECATALGAIRSPDGVAALIDALDDKDQYVLASASDALVKITGQDFKATLNPSAKERRLYKEQWVKWWKDNEGDVRRRLGTEPSPIAPPPGMG